MAVREQELIAAADIRPDKHAPRMSSRALSERSTVVIFSAGDELYSGLTKWARERGITSGHFTAIGALHSAVLGYYDLERKAYRNIPINEQVELLSLIGDFAMDKGQTVLHAHAVVGFRDGSTRGGHLIEAYASPTVELFVTTFPVVLRKQPDPASGLDLIVLDALTPGAG